MSCAAARLRDQADPSRRRKRLFPSDVLPRTACTHDGSSGVLSLLQRILQAGVSHLGEHWINISTPSRTAPSSRLPTFGDKCVVEEFGWHGVLRVSLTFLLLTRLFVPLNR